MQLVLYQNRDDTVAQWRKEKGIGGKAPDIRDFASAEELDVLINSEK